MKKPHYLLILVLVLALSLRLYHVTYPYLDHHSWRQTFTAMISRNYYRDGINILKPEIDYAGNSDSSIEAEFQITPALTSIIFHIFGGKDWVGRIIPVIFSLMSIIFFYKLIKIHYTEKLALLCTFVFSILPINVFFSRVPMPESGMMFFSIASLYYFSEYINKETYPILVLATFFTSLAFLSKLTALYLLFPLGFLAINKYKKKILSKKGIFVFLFITLSVTVFYYGLIHVTAYNKLMPYSIGQDKWGNLSAWLNILFYQTIMARLFSVIFTQAGLLLFLAGIYLYKAKAFFHVWLFSVILYLFVVANGNFVHSYYQMPLLPIGSFYIGLFLYHIYKKRRSLTYMLLAILLILSIINVLPLYDMYSYSAYESGLKMKEIDNSDYLVLTVPHRKDMMTEILYYADKKGWVIWPQDLSVESIEKYRQMGAKYVIMTYPGYINNNLKEYISSKTSYSGKDYLIVKL